MNKYKRLSAKRLRGILNRQEPPARGSGYIPAILATRAEAPADSRPAIVFSPKLGRDIHVLSSVEQRALLFALYHPRIIDLHEQRMLAIMPGPHPLERYPEAKGQILPRLQGTVAVASRIGRLDMHPILKMRKKGELITLPYPMIGDFLLFLTDHLGAYCVNWTVKSSEEDFSRPQKNDQVIRNLEKSRKKSITRHTIEELHYLDAGIPTIRVTERDIPNRLANNLRRLYISHGYRLTVDEPTRIHVVERLQLSLLNGQIPLDVFVSLRSKLHIAVAELKAIMEQAIWARELRVDLFGCPILPDQPLIPERKDVLDEYASWFRRGGS